MQKFVFLFLLPLPVLFTTQAQTKKNGETIQWLTLEEAEAKMKEQPRPILIDLYTDWCGWCKVMDKKTYTQKDLIRYVNQKFYAVKLNAETRAGLTWKGKNYLFNPQYKTHDLAIYLTGGELSYPTTVFIPDYNSEPQPIAGYLEINHMETITTYFGEKMYGKQPFESYARRYKPQWK